MSGKCIKGTPGVLRRCLQGTRLSITCVIIFRTRGGLAWVRGRGMGVGGTGCFVCLFVAQHCFHAIHSQTAEPWARTPET